MMKLFILGFISCLVVGSSGELLWRNYEDGTAADNIGWFIKDKVVTGGYILDPLQGNCDNVTKIHPRDNPNQTTTRAEWFGCDKLQILINRKIK